MKRQGAKILLFDIESTNLAATFGRMLAFGWQWYGTGDPAHVKTVCDFARSFRADPTDDSQLVKFAASEMAKADLWVSWYGQKFDVPFIQTRLLAAGVMPMPPIPHDDCWRIAKYKMRFHSNRLATVSEFLRDALGESIEEKTPLLPSTWARAAAGHRPSILYVAEHCEQDVKVLGQVYQRLKVFAPARTNVAIADGEVDTPTCPHCGKSDAMEKRGFSLALTSRRQRYVCNPARGGCGGWSAGKPQRLAEVR